MKFWIFEINRVMKETPAAEPGTLVVSGMSNKEKLEEFEKHCQEKGFKVIATDLPVLGVFNLSDAQPKNGVKPP